MYFVFVFLLHYLSVDSVMQYHDHIHTYFNCTRLNVKDQMKKLKPIRHSNAKLRFCKRQLARAGKL